MIHVTSKQLRLAANIKDKIAGLQKKLGRVLRTATFGNGGPAEKRPRKKRKMSAAGRAKISKAAKARWAMIKAAKK